MCDTQPIPNIKTKPLPRQSICPSCRQPTSLTYVGEQHWPPRVAERLGMPAIAHLWRCESCQTTITDCGTDIQE